MYYTYIIHADDTRKAKAMTLRAIARSANLNDEASMVAALNEIAKQPLTADQQLYIECVDIDDPSQVYDALVSFGAVPSAWQDVITE